MMMREEMLMMGAAGGGMGMDGGMGGGMGGGGAGDLPPELAMAYAPLPEPTMLNGNQALAYQQYQAVSGPIPPAQFPAYPPRPAGNVGAWAQQQHDLYLHLERQAAALQAVPAQLAQAQADATRADQQLQHARSHLAAAQQTLAETEKKLVKHNDKTLGKLFNHKKFDEKTHQDEAMVAQARGEVERAQKEVAAAEQAVLAPRAELQRLQGLEGQKEQLDAQMASILAALFGGSAGDPAENAAENAVNMCLTLKPQIAVALQDQNIALKYVVESEHKMQAAYKALHRAVAMEAVTMMDNRMDRRVGMMDGGYRPMGGGVTAMGANMFVQQAGQLAQEAQRDLEMAVRHNPFMPMAKTGAIKMPMGMLGSMCNVFFNAPMMDMMFIMKMKGMMREMQGPFQVIVQNVKWQEQFVQNIARDNQNNDAKLAAARQQLLIERVRLIHLMP